MWPHHDHLDRREGRPVEPVQGRGRGLLTKNATIGTIEGGTPDPREKGYALRGLPACTRRKVGGIK